VIENDPSIWDLGWKMNLLRVVYSISNCIPCLISYMNKGTQSVLLSDGNHESNHSM
jgi:hypothetical protein